MGDNSMTNVRKILDDATYNNSSLNQQLAHKRHPSLKQIYIKDASERSLYKTHSTKALINA